MPDDTSVAVGMPPVLAGGGYALKYRVGASPVWACLPLASPVRAYVFPWLISSSPRHPAFSCLESQFHLQVFARIRSLPIFLNDPSTVSLFRFPIPFRLSFPLSFHYVQ